MSDGTPLGLNPSQDTSTAWTNIINESLSPFEDFDSSNVNMPESIVGFDAFQIPLGPYDIQPVPIPRAFDPSTQNSWRSYTDHANSLDSALSADFQWDHSVAQPSTSATPFTRTNSLQSNGTVGSMGLGDFHIDLHPSANDNMQAPNASSFSDVQGLLSQRSSSGRIDARTYRLSHSTSVPDLRYQTSYLINNSSCESLEFGSWATSRSDSLSTTFNHDSAVGNESQTSLSIPFLTEEELKIFNKSFASLAESASTTDLSSSWRAQPQHCTQCDTTCESKDHLDRHTRTEHKAGYKHDCPAKDCLKVFISKKDLRRHVKTVHDRVKDLDCEMCEMKFGRMDKLRDHMKKVHNMVVKTGRKLTGSTKGV